MIATFVLCKWGGRGRHVLCKWS